MDIYIGFKNSDGEPSDALPTQKQLLKLKEKHILAAGSLGWGKTDWLVVQATIEAITWKNNVILLGRKTLSSLKKSTLISFFDLIDPKLIARHDRSEQSITFINNSRIFYMQLDESREAMQKVKSMNLGAVVVDQIEEITENVWIACIGQLRRRAASRRTFATANPNGHSWIWKKWIRNGGGKNFNCIQGTIWKKDVPPPKNQKEVTPLHCDNTNLPYDYIQDRLEQPRRWVDRYVFGSWENFEGLVWSEFDEGLHLVKPFEIPKWWNRFIVLDHGHRNPTAVLFFAVSDEGVVFLYDMHYEADQWIDYHAEQIWRKVRNQQIMRWLADPSIFHVRGGLSSVTIAGQYEDFGIFWEPAINDVSAGIDRVSRYFRPDEESGKPMMYVFDKPELDPFLEEILDYTWESYKLEGSKNAPEKPKKKNDHAMDALRYFINFIEETQPPRPTYIAPQWLEKQKQINSWKTQ